jgi:hypothetical protein
VRSDLPRGIQAAQIVHAAGESSPGNLPAGTYAVVLAVATERLLVQAADVLRQKGIAFTAVFEPDAPFDGAMMAIGLEPGRKEVVGKHVSGFPLLK